MNNIAETILNRGIERLYGENYFIRSMAEYQEGFGKKEEGSEYCLTSDVTP